MFAWRVFTGGSRILCFALFAAAAYAHHLVVFVVVHWAAMVVFILLPKTNLFGSSSDGRRAIQKGYFFFAAVGAAVNVFDFFNQIRGRTRLRCFVYYAIVFAEDLAMIVLWNRALSTPTIRSSWHRSSATEAILGSFFVGVALQMLFYARFHPNNYTSGVTRDRQILVWVPFRQLWTELFRERDPDSTDSKIS